MQSWMDDHYDWAGLYHDPEDPRLWVPKRNPAFGWTINFEHPYGRAMLALILFASVLPLVLGMVVFFHRR